MDERGTYAALNAFTIFYPHRAIFPDKHESQRAVVVSAGVTDAAVWKLLYKTSDAILSGMKLTKGCTSMDFTLCRFLQLEWTFLI